MSFFIDSAMLDALGAEARRNPRLRKNRNFHAGESAVSHRLLNALEPGSYALKIFYAFRQLFQEDFSMVGDSVLAVNYRIINREVYRDDSTTFTGGRIVPLAPGAGAPSSAGGASGSGSPRDQR